MLPERGGTTCFAANYDPPRPIDLSSPRRDERSVGEVSSMRVEIHFRPNEKPFRGGSGGYDWRYSLRLDAGLTNGEHLTSAATCEWSSGFVSRIIPAFALSCYIDCDGGSVTVSRSFGRNALSVQFEPGERLRTGENCSGGSGRVFIGAEQETRSLPVEATGRCGRGE